MKEKSPSQEIQTPIFIRIFYTQQLAAGGFIVLNLFHIACFGFYCPDQLLRLYVL